MSRPARSIPRLWIVVACLFLAACSSPAVSTPAPSATPSPLSSIPATLSPPAESAQPAGEATALPTPFPSPTPRPHAYGPRGFPQSVNPLTGLSPADPAILDRRPVAVKITNFPRSVRPQWGLSRADHIYEYYIGDRMSRFVGVYYGQDASQAGPIRSARLLDALLTRMYRAAFLFGWADDAVLDYLLAPDLLPRLIVENEENCPPLCRIGPKDAYNTLFVDTSLVGAYLTARRSSNDRQNLDGLRFEEAVPKSGNPGIEISLRYSIVSYHRWEYNPQAAAYLRFQETETDRDDTPLYAPLTDSLTGEQLTADNLVMLFVPHHYYRKSSSTDIFDQVLFGEGRGYAFRDGQVYPVLWKHEIAEQLLNLYLPDGRDYPLKPGNTWFEIIGETSDFSIEENGRWSFTFAIP